MAARRLATAVAAAVALAVATGCPRAELCLAGCAETDGGPSDSGVVAPAFTWGAYTATLAVAPCEPSPDPPLVVDTVETTVDDPTPEQTLVDTSRAGPTLSLPEAVWIAARRTSPSTILFSRDVFPPEAPGRIELTLDQRFPVAQGLLCIDARDRGVVLAWPVRLPTDPLPCVTSCLPTPGNGARRVIGLQFENPPTSLVLGPQSELAGCRFSGTAGGSSPSQRSMVQLQYGTVSLGPGNAFLPSGGTSALAVLGQGTPGEDAVFGNSFGVDPVSGEVAPPGLAIVASSGTRFADNVLAGVTVKPLGTDGEPIIFTRNFVGVDRTGRALPAGARAGLAFVVDPQVLYVPNRPVVLGPGNFLSGIEGPAVFVGARTEVEIVGNRLTGNDAGIVFEGAAPVSPPSIVSVSAAQIEASCPTAGRLELFVDKGDQGEVPLLAGACDATARPYAVPTSVTLPSGRFITGTVTVGRSTSAFSAPVPVP